MLIVITVSVIDQLTSHVRHRLIGLQEMTYLAKQASAATRSPFAFFLFTASLFLIYTWVSLTLLRKLHGRYSLGAKRGELCTGR